MNEQHPIEKAKDFILDVMQPLAPLVFAGDIKASNEQRQELMDLPFQVLHYVVHALSHQPTERVQSQIMKLKEQTLTRDDLAFMDAMLPKS